MSLREMNEQEQKQVTFQLSQRAQLFLGADMNDSNITKLEEFVKDLRQRWRLRGIDVPPFAVLVFPKILSVDIIRRDIDVAGIQTVIVNLTKKYPSITPEDIAFGIGRAFPEYVRHVQAANANKRWQEPALSGI